MACCFTYRSWTWQIPYFMWPCLGCRWVIWSGVSWTWSQLMAALLHSDWWYPCSAVLISMFKSYVFMIMFIINLTGHLVEIIHGILIDEAGSYVFESCRRCCYIAVHLVHSCWKGRTVSMFRAKEFKKFLHSLAWGWRQYDPAVCWETPSDTVSNARRLKPLC